MDFAEAMQQVETEDQACPLTKITSEPDVVEIKADDPDWRAAIANRRTHYIFATPLLSPEDMSLELDRHYAFYKNPTTRPAMLRMKQKCFIASPVVNGVRRPCLLIFQPRHLTDLIGLARQQWPSMSPAEHARVVKRMTEARYLFMPRWQMTAEYADEYSDLLSDALDVVLNKV